MLQVRVFENMLFESEQSLNKSVFDYVWTLNASLIFVVFFCQSNIETVCNDQINVYFNTVILYKC